jgi:hypothetical protein
MMSVCKKTGSKAKMVGIQDNSSALQGDCSVGYLDPAEEMRM